MIYVTGVHIRIVLNSSTCWVLLREKYLLLRKIHAGLIRKNDSSSVRYISFIVMRAFVAYFSAHVYKFNTYTQKSRCVSECVWCVCISAPSVQLVNFSWHPL